MKKFLAGLMMGVMMLAGVSAVAVQPVWADATLCDEITDAELRQAAGCDEHGTADTMANNIIQVVLSLLGVLAIGVMIVGGIMYMISTGDAAKVHRAKNLIMYGLIGLVISLLAYVIVAFVIKSVTG